MGVEPQVGDIVKVVWLDPAYRYEERKRDLRRRFRPTRIRTFGEVVGVETNWFWIAHELLDSASVDDYRGVTVLPTSIVEEYTVLHVAQEEVPDRSADSP